MGLILDTSVLIDIENYVPQTIQRLRELTSRESEIPSISFVTYFEFLYGIKNKSPENQKKQLMKLNRYRLLNTSSRTPHILADLKYQYDKKGIIFSVTDLTIAAQAKEHNLTLITKDRLFEKIDEIRTIILD